MGIVVRQSGVVDKGIGVIKSDCTYYWVESNNDEESIINPVFCC